LFYVKNTLLTAHAQAKLEQMRRKDPGYFWLPNEPQADMLRAIGTTVPKKRIFLITSGNGTGKTTGVVNVCRALCTGRGHAFKNITDNKGRHISGFFDYPLFNEWPKQWPKHIWYVSNKDALNSIWEEFEKWLPPEDYTAKKNSKSFISEVIFHKTGWKISFKTVDQDPKTFEAANIGCIIFDEPPLLALYRAGISRLRTGGFVLIPATPLFGSAWFVDEIVDRQDEGDKYHQTVSVWENCIESSGWWDLGDYGVQPKGCLTRANILFTLNNYDQDERKAREFGIFQHLSGLIYKTYVSVANPLIKGKELSHVQHIPKSIRPQLYVYQFVVDPHDRRPPAACWIRIDQWGRRRVIREWPSVYDPQYAGNMFHKIKAADPYVVDDFVRFWCQIEKELGIPNDRVQAIMDPNFGRKPVLTTGKMVSEEYSAAFNKYGRPRGFITEGVIDDLATGHKKVKALLKPTPQGDLYFTVGDQCKNMDWGFRNYKYKDWKGKAAEDRDLSENVSEIGKDFPDLARYAAVYPIEWWPPDMTHGSMNDDYQYGKDEMGMYGNQEDLNIRPEGSDGL